MDMNFHAKKTFINFWTVTFAIMDLFLDLLRGTVQVKVHFGTMKNGLRLGATIRTFVPTINLPCHVVSEANHIFRQSTFWNSKFARFFESLEFFMLCYKKLAFSTLVKKILRLWHTVTLFYHNARSKHSIKTALTIAV